jgi:hypothetical protein
MRTSLNEIAEIEHYLLGEKADGDSLLTEAKIQLNPALRVQVAHQQEAYRLIQQYGRKQIRAEITAVEESLFSQRKYRHFRRIVFRLFGLRNT